MANKESRSQLFDEWAAHYDRSVGSTNEFPFEGYEQVLKKIIRLASAQSHMLVLDLGTGTGNLAKWFVGLGCRVLGTDFSDKMLAQARAKLPQAKFIQVDLLGAWPSELNLRFDRIVSAYVFHEFDLSTKINLIQKLAYQHLTDDGCLVIGDIAFPTVIAREQAHQLWANQWDEDEHYWAADETQLACAKVGLGSCYSQVSSCGGVFVIESIQGREDAV